MEYTYCYRDRLVEQSTASGLTTTVSSSNATSYSTTAQTSNSTLGLRLVLSVNSTSIHSGDTLSLTASVQNILPTINNVSRSSNWGLPSRYLSSNSSMDYVSQNSQCQQYLTYRLFSGYQTLSNISSSAPLYLLPSGFPAPTCPSANSNPAWFAFQPSSNVFSESAFYGPETVFSAETHASLSGYFSNSYATTSNPVRPSTFAISTSDLHNIGSR